MANLPTRLPGAGVASSIESNQRAIAHLTRAIALSRGQFSLILACCDSATLRSEISRALPQRTGMEVWELTLSPSATTLLTTIKDSLSQHPEALLIFGLESVIAIEALLGAANLARNEFSRTFSFPIVLWVNEKILQKLRRIAPDFRSWANNPIYFESPELSLGKRATTQSQRDRLPAREQTSKAIAPNREPWTAPPIRFERFVPPHITSQQSFLQPSSEPPPPSPKVIPTSKHKASEVLLAEIYCLEDMERVIQALRERKSVILKMCLDLAEGQRALDFAIGGTHALDGDQLKLDEALFLLVPSCVRLSRDLAPVEN